MLMSADASEDCLSNVATENSSSLSEIEISLNSDYALGFFSKTDSEENIDL